MFVVSPLFKLLDQLRSSTRARRKIRAYITLSNLERKYIYLIEVILSDDLPKVWKTNNSSSKKYVCCGYFSF